MLDEKEMAKKLKRKNKRLREKSKETEAEAIDMNTYFSDFSKRFQYSGTHHFPKKVRTLSFSNKSQNSFAVNTHNNSIEFYTYNFESEQNQIVPSKKIDSFGHRSAVRTVALSPDDSIILTGSGESVKLWSMTNYTCFRSFETGYCVSSIFLPGNKFFLVGDKQGMLTLFDVNKAEKITEIKAHDESQRFVND